MPLLLVPATVSVALMVIPLEPQLRALMPVAPPDTCPEVLTSISPPLVSLTTANMPNSEVPVTSPVAVTLTDPDPLTSAAIPRFPPLTVAAAMVTDAAAFC